MTSLLGITTSRYCWESLLDVNTSRFCGESPRHVTARTYNSTLLLGVTTSHCCQGLIYRAATEICYIHLLREHITTHCWKESIRFAAAEVTRKLLQVRKSIAKSAIFVSFGQFLSHPPFLPPSNAHAHAQEHAHTSRRTRWLCMCTMIVCVQVLQFHRSFAIAAQEAQIWNARLL